MAQIRPINPELKSIAINELNEVDDKIVEEISHLRSWVESQPHLKARTDDQFLITFLRYCKYDQDLARKRLDYFFTYKTKHVDLVKSRQIDDMLLEICHAGIFATLPNPAGPGGPRIHVTRVGNINTSKFTVRDIFRFYMFRSEMEINSDDNWNIVGHYEIIDMSRISFSLLRQFEPSLFKRMACLLEYGLPTNLKGTHIVNASREAQLVLMLIRAVMKEKELLNIHSNMESLQKAIGKEYLPVEYGGNNGTFSEAEQDMENQLISFTNYFHEDVEYIVNETLRPRKSSLGVQQHINRQPSSHSTYPEATTDIYKCNRY